MLMFERQIQGRDILKAHTMELPGRDYPFHLPSSSPTTSSPVYVTQPATAHGPCFPLHLPKP